MAIGDGDIEAIYANGDFDTGAIFTRRGDQVGGEVRGWPTSATEEVNLLTQQIEAFDMKFDCATSAVTAIRKGDTATIDGTDYTVERKQDLGNGSTTLYLKTQ